MKAEKTSRGRGPGSAGFRGSIGLTILIFNVLLVFLPVTAFFFLDTYEKRLLRSLERGMSEQARAVAAALGGGDSGLGSRARTFIASLENAHEARIRVFGTDGRVLADSAGTPTLPPRKEGAIDYREENAAAKREPQSRDDLLYKIGSWPVRLAREFLSPPRDASGGTDVFDSKTPFAEEPEIRAALENRYGATTRIVPGNEGSTVRLYSAMPISGGGSVQGVVLVSQSTVRILADIYAMRLDIFRIFLYSVLVALGLSVVSDVLIARPLRKLAAKAEGILDGRGRIRGTFGGTKALGEIGSLSRTLAEMGGKLERHTRFLESFAEDLAHEIRNPLASVRASLELLSEGETDEGRKGLVDRARADVERINHLVGDVREITSLDAESGAVPYGPFRPIQLSENAAAAFRTKYPDTPLLFKVDPGIDGAGEGFGTNVDPDRFIRVLDNLLDNAASFAPPGTHVELELKARDDGSPGLKRIIVRDYGPGFPELDAERIFERFYSSRKEQGLHSGLGLSIVRGIVSSWGAGVRAELADPGARFIVEFP